MPKPIRSWKNTSESSKQAFAARRLSLWLLLGRARMSIFALKRIFCCGETAKLLQAAKKKCHVAGQDLPKSFAPRTDPSLRRPSEDAALKRRWVKFAWSLQRHGTERTELLATESSKPGASLESPVARSGHEPGPERRQLRQKRSDPTPRIQARAGPQDAPSWYRTQGLGRACGLSS